jgi:hypothetical protein
MLIRKKTSEVPRPSMFHQARETVTYVLNQVRRNPRHGFWVRIRRIRKTELAYVARGMVHCPVETSDSRVPIASQR